MVMLDSSGKMNRGRGYFFLEGEGRDEPTRSERETSKVCVQTKPAFSFERKNEITLLKFARDHRTAFFKTTSVLLKLAPVLPTKCVPQRMSSNRNVMRAVIFFILFGWHVVSTTRKQAKHVRHCRWLMCPPRDFKSFFKVIETLTRRTECVNSSFIPAENGLVSLTSIW